MALSWDRRVVPERVLEVLSRSQARVECRIAGGAALSGVHLHHRLSRDVDLFFDDKPLVRELSRQLDDVAQTSGARFRSLRDSGSVVRGSLEFADSQIEIDLVYEPSARVAERDQVEGLTVESLADLRANKLTCLLSRSEPRDLVDLYFLDRAGFPPESDLAIALSKDGGIDPGILAHLLRDFPLAPLPQLLVSLTTEELTAYRDDLAQRFRYSSLPRE
ncbi:MAG TPA: nucleotidyl transferase AbiEii/AbiGii toxin family protein [Polyangiaceae bacterium]|nr:nucleotidyl transferase AbiEii/AbiGii toxin family protein [Polyangiaceae bacterium]